MIHLTASTFHSLTVSLSAGIWCEQVLVEHEPPLLNYFDSPSASGVEVLFQAPQISCQLPSVCSGYEYWCRWGGCSYIPLLVLLEFPSFFICMLFLKAHWPIPADVTARRFCPQCHVKVDLDWHPQIPCFCLNKDTKVLSNLFICQLFYVIHVPLHHVRHIHLLLLCQAANMSRKRADKSCGHGKIIPFFPGIGQSASPSPLAHPFL